MLPSCAHNLLALFVKPVPVPADGGSYSLRRILRPNEASTASLQQGSRSLMVVMVVLSLHDDEASASIQYTRQAKLTFRALQVRVVIEASSADGATLTPPLYPLSGR